MAKVAEAKKDKLDPDKSAMAALLNALTKRNEFSNPTHEVARVDAAEIILKYATPDEKDAAVAAFDFLVQAVENQIASVPIPQRVRAAGIIVRYKRGAL